MAILQVVDAVIRGQAGRPRLSRRFAAKAWLTARTSGPARVAATAGRQAETPPPRPQREIPARAATPNPMAGGSATQPRPREREERPHRSPGADDLAQPVQAEHQEGVERELLEGSAAAQAGEKRGRGDAEPEDESDGEPQARGRARGERPQEVQDGHDPGGGQDHLPRPPANGQVENGATVGLRAALGPLTQAAG